MQDVRSRVTVIGAKKQVDVAVPSSAPIGEYVVGLAKLCGQERRDLLPAAWTLAPAAASPLSPGASLADAGITDGQVLYLRDLVRDPDDVEIVSDVDEMVIDEAERMWARAVPSGLLATTLGLLWLFGAAVFLLVTHGDRMAAAAGLVCAGFLLLGLGWALEQRQVAMPPTLFLAISLCAAPCFAGAGGLLAQSAAGADFRWSGAIVGLNVGVILTLAAMPVAEVFVLELQLAAAALVAPALVAVKADSQQVLGAAALTALAMVVSAKWCAATVAAFAPGRSTLTAADGAASPSNSVLLARTRRMLLVVLAGPTIALAVTLPLLGRSGEPFAVGLGVVISIALLARAAQSVLSLEAAGLAAAGTAGLFGALSAVVEVRSAGGWGGLLLVFAGLVIVLAGVSATALRRPTPTGPPEPSGPPKRRLVDVVGTICVALSAPVALGAFGILGQLLDRGQHMMH